MGHSAILLKDNVAFDLRYFLAEGPQTIETASATTTTPTADADQAFLAGCTMSLMPALLLGSVLTGCLVAWVFLIRAILSAFIM
ncbi:hypothetical protein [Rubellimicrobium arenae]|uniref:hypothetical protein n=1 Tax=Rubellimicrobium arenae TaxID=2817372 RepID=UPI001B306FA5|nr:hypothetical protein [Rubellimicrobium arenae]